MKIYLSKKEVPQNESFAYVLGKDGVFLVKRNAFFEACVKVDEISELSEIKEEVRLKVQKIPYSIIRDVMNFFLVVYQKHESEAMVLLVYEGGKWDVVVPEQTVSGASIDYKNYENRRIVGSIHSHPGFSSYASGIDEDDELNFDGFHLIISSFNEVMPDIGAYLVVNGSRFEVDPEDLIEGVGSVAGLVDPLWMNKVKEKPKHYASYGCWRCPDNRICTEIDSCPYEEDLNRLDLFGEEVIST